MTSIKIDRQKLALSAIKQALGTEQGEDGINLFVEHHLEELPSAYWQEHLGTVTPDAESIVGLMELRSSWGENDAEYFDFTLPGEVTDYVVSVHFDQTGNIDGMSMES